MPPPQQQDVGDRFINRELSWIDFNERVLSLAEGQNTPLLERLKFLAIFSNNLDEFFMVRVAGLKTQLGAGVAMTSPDGLTAKAQLSAISEKVISQVHRQASLFTDEIKPLLAANDIRILRWKQLDDPSRKELDEMFRERIFPVVTPLAVDPGHPFPYISNLSLNLAVLVRDPDSKKTLFARVKVPPLFPRFVSVSDPGLFVPLDDVIAANLDLLFPGMEIVEHHAFRVTRNADFEVDDDGAEDLLLALEDQIHMRRSTPAVRLEIESDMSDYVLDLLKRELQVSDEDVHTLPGPLNLAGLWDIYNVDRPDLKDPTFTPVTPPDLVTADESSPDIFKTLWQQDVLVHHPYDSFKLSVERFIEQAAADPDVLAIKQTLYRTSGESPIVDALIQGARAGKQVVVLVEIKARFDELANINWARTLEAAGCHVVYGLIGLKTHSKLCDPELGADVSNLFNYLTGYSRQRTYRSLLVAPHGLREEIISRIQREADHVKEGHRGRIIMKLNSLVDESVIDGLYEASSAGVQIDLVVRGICALKPQVLGLSENIRVKSILGRFLEHSRIFHFDNGGDGDVYIGSADMMHRNLDRRVEALVRVRDSRLKDRLRSILELALADNHSSWSLGPDGSWEKVKVSAEVAEIDLQKELIARALSHA
jgi:polyphosphate kinase